MLRDPGLLQPEPLSSWQATAHPCLHRKYSNTQRQVWFSLCGPLGPGARKVFFEPSECLWQVWSLILNMILPLLLSCWGFSFALRHGVSFSGGIQHSPFDGCSAASCILEFSEKLSTCPSTLPFCHFGLKIY